MLISPLKKPHTIHSCFRYWDAVAKQQQQQRKADEEVHRQQWAAYFEGQAAVVDGQRADAFMNGDIEGEVLDDPRHCDPVLEGVGIFGGIFYKDDEEKST